MNDHSFTMGSRSLVLSVLLLVASAAASANDEETHRSLALQHLAGFIPVTQIADQASIDQDQAMIVKYLEEKTEQSFQVARNIYEKGAFSRSYATLTLRAVLPSEVKQGTPVHGVTVDGMEVMGEVLRTTAKGQNKISVLYDTTDSDVDYTGCRVAANPNPVKDGCFAADGFLTIDGIDDEQEYYYNLIKDNLCDRTIESMSRHADYKMKPCGKCDYYKDFNRFYEYYGQPDYADKWIDTAFEGKTIAFKHGEWDFSHYSFESRAEAIKRATVYLSIANYVSKQLSDAFYKCQNRSPCTGDKCDINDVRMMEGGVAFYAGSLEGQDGKGIGVLLYDLADRMCKDFKTCGEKGDATTGTSKVNEEIMHEFFEMQQALLSHKCAEARKHQERIGALLYVPLLQGTLRQAYVTGKASKVDSDEEAAGAAFAASVLPIVAKCSQDDAQIIYENMKPNHESKTDFAAVKGALERNYGCLKVTCEDVGGYYYGGVVGGAMAHYYADAEPCVTEGTETQALEGGQIAGITVGALAATLLACCCFCYLKWPRRRRSSSALTIPSSGEAA